MTPRPSVEQALNSAAPLQRWAAGSAQKRHGGQFTRFQDETLTPRGNLGIALSLPLSDFHPR